MSWEQDPEAFARRMRAMRSEIASHPGTRARSAWLALRRTTDLHYRNLAELEQLIARAERAASLAIELVQNVRPSPARDEFGARLDQRLHNATASAVTLVDHARRLVGRYPGSAFAHEFNVRNDRIKDDPRAVFLRRLRNYLLHYDLAPVVHNVRFQQEQPRFRSIVALGVPVLLDWPDWGAPATKLLQDAGQLLDLGALIRWYIDVTRELYSWLFGQFESLHGEEVLALRELVTEYDTALSAWPSGEDQRSNP